MTRASATTNRAEMPFKKGMFGISLSCTDCRPGILEGGTIFGLLIVATGGMFEWQTRYVIGNALFTRG